MLDSSLVQVTIKELSVNAYLGVHDHEQAKPTKVSVDLEFAYKRPTTDCLTAAIDYASVRNTVFLAVENRRFALVETMAETILYAVIAEPRMAWSSVRVHKYGALKQASSVVALVEWRRVEVAKK
jgi:dihydroneopterin aldolase